MKISLILPVCQVETQVTECLQSILTQSFDDFEIIVIDNCGTAGNLSEARSMLAPSGQKTFRPPGRFTISYEWVTHFPSQDYYAACNRGISAAKGDYLLFVDANSHLLPDALHHLYDVTKKTHAYVTIGRDKFSDNSQPLSDRNSFSYSVWEGKIEAVYAFMESKIDSKITNKLFKRDFLQKNHLTFCEGILHSENLWAFSWVCHVPRVAVTGYETCCYGSSRSEYMVNGKGFTSHYESYLRILSEMAEIAFKCDIYKDPVFRHWYEKQKALYFSKTMASGDSEQLRHLYHMICRLLPSRKSTKTMIHYHMPSVIGYAVYIRMHKMLLG